MNKFNEILRKNNLSAFLQIKDDKETLAYALILDENNNGIVHGYEGGGEFTEAFVVNGEVMEDIEVDGEYLDWDEMGEAWSEKSGSSTKPDTLIGALLELGEVQDGGAILLGEDERAVFEDLKAKSIEFGEIEPVDYGFMSFEKTA